ncbi:MAG: SRPBCC family protein [Thermoleophilia bacterium]|nr:SRPBCC family protein [Thermoleophilia bacterium]
MRLENSFEVAAPRRQAWELLLDVPRVVPCMPGAELEETVSDTAWKAKLSVKLGPISLAFATDVTMEETNEQAGTVTLSAKARELRGRGGAQARITSALSDAGSGTRVDIATDLMLSGAVAQYGRGIVQDVSSQLVARFADCLQAQLAAATPEEAAAAVAEQAKPVSGLSLGLGALGRAVARFFARLFGRGSKS